MTESSPPPPDDERRLEHGIELTPRFDANGLITAVVTDAADGELLMLAHMNAEALRLTLDSGFAHFYSRSRKALWKKGESSGNLLSVREIRVDCDQDAIWLKVDVAGSGVACHTGERSCFYRIVARRPDGTVELRQQPL